MRCDITPVGELSGDGIDETDGPASAALITSPDEADEIACSDIAVVATAFAAPDVPKGMRPLENRDELETREARDPGRRGEGIVWPWCVWATVVVSVGDGGGFEFKASGEGALERGG